MKTDLEMAAERARIYRGLAADLERESDPDARAMLAQFMQIIDLMARSDVLRREVARLAAAPSVEVLAPDLAEGMRAQGEMLRVAHVELLDCIEQRDFAAGRAEKAIAAAQAALDMQDGLLRQLAVATENLGLEFGPDEAEPPVRLH